MIQETVRRIIMFLQTCAKEKDLYAGARMHIDVLKQGFLQKNVFVGTTLIDMYAKCGALSKAQLVFDKLPVQNIASWTALIGGYVQFGYAQEAFDLLEQMKEKGLNPDAVTYACVLKACANTRSAQKGREIHAEILKQGLLRDDVILGTALVDMYVKCGSLARAQEVFDEILDRNAVCWNVVISGYCQHGYCEEALSVFQKMLCEGHLPDALTFTCILKACRNIGAIEKGKHIHAKIIRGILKSNMLGNALLDMYTKCGNLSIGRELFHDLNLRDAIGFTILITGYAQHGHGEEAATCFGRMQIESFVPDAVTFTCILKACGSMKAAEKGKEIHAKLVKEGLLIHDSVLGNALVDMYAKCGALAMAQRVFDELCIRDIVSWTSMISGYSKHGHGDETLSYFQRLQLEGFYPNMVTFACILQACGNMGVIEKGKEIHVEIVREDLLGKDTMIGNALIDMYSKCGEIVQAKEVFDKLPFRDVVSWTAMIAGYSQIGKYENVFHLFSQMTEEGVMPNMVTFLIVLDTCSSSCSVDKGEMYFEAMATDYGITPTVEHYTCMIDLFAQGGHFNKAISMLRRMPTPDYLPAWLALLGACQKWGCLILGKLAFENSVRLDEKCAVAYDLMRNIYLDAGMHENVKLVESMKMENETEIT